MGVLDGMGSLEIAAQALSILAMLFNIFSYQQRSHRAAVLFQLFGCALFGASYFMLGATVGGILNCVGIVRSIVFIFKDKLKSDRLPWLILFAVLYIASYVLVFTVFDKVFNAYTAITELLPVIAMTALTVGFMKKDAGHIRICGLIASPCWLIYNIVSFSIGAIICEVLSLISIIIGIVRMDKKQNTETNK